MIDRYVSSATGSNTYAQSVSNATPCSLATAIQFGTGGDRFNVRADAAYVLGANLSFTGSGNSNSPIVWRGWSGTPGDGFQGRINNNGPLIITNFPLFNCANHLFQISSGWQIFDSLYISGNSIGPVTFPSVAGSPACAMINSLIQSSDAVSVANGIVEFNSNNVATLANCDILATAPSVTIINGVSATTNSRILYNRIIMSGVGTGSCGIIAISSPTIVGNIIIGTSGSGIGIVIPSVNAIPTILSNTIIGFQDGINLGLSPTTASLVLINNLITDNSGYGINTNGGFYPNFAIYNRFRNNSLGWISTSSDWITGIMYGIITTGTASDYINFANQDLRLIATSPAVTNALQYPASIGALQIPSGAGGGGGETSYSFA